VTFKEYYEHYLTLHKNKTCRRLHILGQLATLATIFFVLYTKMWLLLLAVPFVVYPFAWAGHFFFEKNRPAAFSRPLWAKACDWVMFKDVLLGKIEI
tara:strand:- start:3360 stop:3650 length:291 start_codon:yes stop_codon:yes gene_type:complete